MEFHLGVRKVVILRSVLFPHLPPPPPPPMDADEPSSHHNARIRTYNIYPPSIQEPHVAIPTAGGRPLARLVPRLEPHPRLGHSASQEVGHLLVR